MKKSKSYQLLGDWAELTFYEFVIKKETFALVFGMLQWPFQRTVTVFLRINCNVGKNILETQAKYM